MNHASWSWSIPYQPWCFIMKNWWYIQMFRLQKCLQQAYFLRDFMVNLCILRRSSKCSREQFSHYIFFQTLQARLFISLLWLKIWSIKLIWNQTIVFRIYRHSGIYVIRRKRTSMAQSMSSSVAVAQSGWFLIATSIDRKKSWTLRPSFSGFGW